MVSCDDGVMQESRGCYLLFFCTLSSTPSISARNSQPAVGGTVRMDPNVSSATVDASALDVSCSLMYLQQMQKGVSV